jgi:hypothetical protein
MNTVKSEGLVMGEKVPAIALRITDKKIYERIEELSKEQNISKNMVVNMLLGFAFNEVDRQHKKFSLKVVFESE